MHFFFVNWCATVLLHIWSFSEINVVVAVSHYVWLDERKKGRGVAVSRLTAWSVYSGNSISGLWLCWPIYCGTAELVKAACLVIRPIKRFQKIRMCNILCNWKYSYRLISLYVLGYVKKRSVSISYNLHTSENSSLGEILHVM